MAFSRGQTSYLHSVYPTAAMSGASSISALNAHDVHWYYTDGVAPLPMGVVSPETHRCKDGFLNHLRRLDNSKRFGSDLTTACRWPPRGSALSCIRQLYNHHEMGKYSSGQLSGKETQRYVEVTHLAFNSKLPPNSSRAEYKISWPDFLDSGRSGWWFTHAPGSGIFFDAGVRRCEATFKNALMIDLLTLLLSRGLRPPCLGHGVCPNASRFLEAVRQTRSAPCPKWIHCRYDFILDDQYDPTVRHRPLGE